MGLATPLNTVTDPGLPGGGGCAKPKSRVSTCYSAKVFEKLHGNGESWTERREGRGCVSKICLRTSATGIVVILRHSPLLFNDSNRACFNINNKQL